MLEVVFLCADLVLIFLLLRWSLQQERAGAETGGRAIFDYRDPDR